MNSPGSPADERGMVIVGGGLAGAKGAQGLRDLGFTGPITLVSAEADFPYERPPLSKDYLAGKSEFAAALVHPPAWYAENQVDLRQSTRAVSIDPAGHTVGLDDGTTIAYDKLLLATGATPRRLSLAGADADNVLYLRTHADSDALRKQFGPDRRLVIIGAGWIGLEAAAAARGAGTDVSVIEMAEWPLLPVVGPELGKVFADLHTSNGVALRLSTNIERLTDEGGRVSGVQLTSGEVIPADAVLVGVGVAPDVGLAEAAGLKVDNGVLVDASLRTSDPDIYAVGDIANHDHPTLHTRVRVEHWATALNQPKAAAAAMLGRQGDDAVYNNLPYFFSDQYDLGIEYVGYIPRGLDTRLVTRGDVAGREFVAFWVDPDNRVRAAMHANTWDAIDPIKALVNRQAEVDPDLLADPDTPLTDLGGSTSDRS